MLNISVENVIKTVETRCVSCYEDAVKIPIIAQGAYLIFKFFTRALIQFFEN